MNLLINNITEKTAINVLCELSNSADLIVVFNKLKQNPTMKDSVLIELLSKNLNVILTK